MEQLAPADSLLLSVETTTMHGHTGGVTILDRDSADALTFERFEAVLRERVPLVPRFCRKVHEVPLGLDRPYWVDDPNFDVSHHLDHVGLPAPGGDAELAVLLGRLMSRQLDRDRPLWEACYIDGLAENRVAIFFKTHHCLMDGVSGAGLSEVLCDLEPDAAPRAPVDIDTEPREIPDPIDLAIRTAANAIARPMTIASYLPTLLPLAIGALSGGIGGVSAPTAPDLAICGDTGTERGFAFVSIPLEDVKRLRRHFEVTVNDVILALTGSTVRRYLERIGQPSALPAVAMVPVSTRDQGDGGLGNQVSYVNVSLETHNDDPAGRLLAVSRNMQRARAVELETRFPVEELIGLGLFPGALNLASRAVPTSLARRGLGNFVVSSVRGAPMPLFSAGARIESMYPLSGLLPGQGVNFTAISYLDRIELGITVDPALVADPWALADGVTAALEELLAVASS